MNPALANFAYNNRKPILNGTAIILGGGAVFFGGRYLYRKAMQKKFLRLEQEGNPNARAARQIFNELPENLKLKTNNFLASLLTSIIGVQPPELRDLVNWFGQKDRYHRLFKAADTITNYEEAKQAFKYMFQIGDLDFILQKALTQQDYISVTDRARAAKVTSKQNPDNQGKYIITIKETPPGSGAFAVNGSTNFKATPAIPAGAYLGQATATELMLKDKKGILGSRTVTLPSGKKLPIKFLIDASAVKLVSWQELNNTKIKALPINKFL